MDFKNRLSTRRQFLIGSGSSLLLPPLLSLMSPLARAQALAPKRRFVVMVGLCGIDQQQFFPAAQPDLIPVAGPLSTYYKPLANFSGQISRMIDSDFVPMYSKMNLMQGLSMTGGLYQGHNTTILAGCHSQGRFGDGVTMGRSLDVVMEKSANVYKSGESVPFKAIRLACGPDHDAPFSYDTVGGPRISDYLAGDVQLFNKIFAKFTPPGGSTAPASDDKLIVDKVYADLKALENNTRLSSSDKLVLDRYISSVFDLQLKVNSSANAPTCTKPSLSLQASGDAYYLPDYPGWNKNLNVSTMYDNINEMIRLAFICDLTRVVFIGNERCTADTPVFLDTHHDAPGSEAAADRQKWGLKKFLKLAKSLDATADPSGQGTLLDNSLLFFTNELGDWTTGHSTFNMPALTFGSCGGYFRTGNYVDYRQKPLKEFAYYYPGRPYKQLLQSMMLAMGVTKSEYMQFGDGNGFGEFKAGINQFGQVSTTMFKAYEPEHNDPLPFVSKVS